jgi:copper chaperone NosL
MKTHLRLTRRGFTAGILLTPLALAGCGGEQADAATPPAIAYGRDTCDRCGMIIADERFAGGLVADDGEAEVFDDLGEMLQSRRESGEDSRQVWVHDWSSSEWIDGTTATYVRSAPELTPMGTGIVAFAQPDDADAFIAERGGERLSWDEALAATPAPMR